MRTTHRGAAYAASSLLSVCSTCVGKGNEEKPRFISGNEEKRAEGGFFFLIYMALILLDENIIVPAIEIDICPHCVQEVFILV